ncbi:thioesterase thiol ester dehydrase-isomerase [Dentipellis sp. KUC8613]|nr:thioesterase thiol ester dehydrase-isomerase [Dentipellis sp. KUC8613]
MSQTLSTTQARDRRRTDYRYFLTYQTRWSDNDQYSHVNNSVYYHFFDSIVNQYLITNCNLSPQTSPLIGLVVSSWSLFFSPVSFPDNLELALRINKLGNSSVTYEVGVFRGDSQEPSAVGGYTHVFVERESRKSAPLDETMRKGLEYLLAVTSDDGASSRNLNSKL